MELNLKGKVAIVTGGSMGIGRSIALGLAEEGVRSTICARGVEDLEKVKKEVEEKGGETHIISADLSKSDNIQEIVNATLEIYGKVDILINNVGWGTVSEFAELTDDDWQYNFDLNVMSAVRLSREVIPHLQKQGGGRIINISSGAAKQPIMKLVDYNVVKTAMLGLTKSLSDELAKDNILVNCVCPGPILTPLWERPGGTGDTLAKAVGMPKEEAMKWYIGQQVPLGRFGKPEEIADMAIFLASDRASYITGVSICVDGGQVKSII